MTNPNTGKVPLTVPVTVNLPKPPEGMEWQIREPVPQREYYAGKMVNIEAVLRPIQPATVMVEMLRDDAGWVESQCRPSDFGQAVSDRATRVANTMRAALARKPCPVMVCGLRQTACYSEEPDRCLDRRPCKHSEGHGGEHE